jgi:hypothetical protein
MIGVIPHLRAVTRIFDFGMHERARSEKQVSIGEAQSLQIDTLAAPGDITTTYFVRLELQELSPKGAVLRTFPPNFYWLSKKKEILDWSRTDFKYTPVVSDADLTDLQKLPNVCVQLSAKVSGHASARDSEEPFFRGAGVLRSGARGKCR